MRGRSGGGWLAGAAALGIIVLLAAAAPWIVAADPLRTDLVGRLRPPGPGHPLGQDALGRDVLARLLFGARVSLVAGGATVAFSCALGVPLGLLAGYRGGWLDEAIGRVIDVLLAFPGLLLAIALTAVLGPSLRNVVLALSLLGWTGYARLARAEAAAARGREFVTAATALGAGPLRIVARHILPQAAPALVVQATFGLCGAITAEAGLSFLGLGVPPPQPSWGSMLAEGREFLLVAPHLLLAPGTALASTVLALQLLGDGLVARLDAPQDWQRGQ
jgi:peptide/nickel transport system permease protein